MINQNKKVVLTVFLMIFATLCSKLLGMLRQMMMAGIFAAGIEGIAFSAASKIPFAIFDMLFSTAILGSFLPIYRGHLLSDEKRANAFSSSFFTLIGLVTASVAVVGVILARPIVTLAAPNLNEETMTLAVSLLRIMFPAIIFAGAAYTLIGIMQSHEKFLLPAMISAVSNAIIITYLVFCSQFSNKRAAIFGLAAVYLISWAAQFVTLTYPLLRARHMPKISLQFQNPDLILAEKRTLPVMLSAWLIPMTTLTANAFSSYIDGSTVETGAVQGAAIVVFENAFSVFTIAGGLMTYGICNYLFPKLSARFASGDKDGFGASARMGLFVSVMVTLPIAIAIFLLSDEIIRLLYLRGNFTEGLANAAAKSLTKLAPALPAYSMIEFLSRTCYSCGKVKYPMISAIIGMLTGFLSALLFSLCGMLTVSAVAFSAALGLITAALVLFWLSRHAFAGGMTRNVLKKLTLWLLGVMLSALIMAFSHAFFKNFLQNAGAFRNFLIIAIVFIMGFMVYLIWIILFRNIIFSKTSSGKEGNI